MAEITETGNGCTEADIVLAFRDAVCTNDYNPLIKVYDMQFLHYHDLTNSWSYPFYEAHNNVLK